jgi:hypothetical protein
LEQSTDCRPSRSCRTCRAEASSMPAGPAAGRVEAQRRALTTPSTAPASKSRRCDAWIWVFERDASAENTCVVPERSLLGFLAILFLRISTRTSARGRRVPPAPRARRDSDMRHDQRWRERPRLDGLGSLAGQDTGVVHAIVGSPTATPTPAVTAAQSAAAVARPAQDAAIVTLARSERSRCDQG